MTNSGMMICSFFLKERFCRGEENLYPLNSKYRFDNGEHTYSDIFDMMTAFCKENFSFSDDEKNMKMFSIGDKSVTSFDGDTYRAMSFIIRSGAYGIEADVTDRRTKQVKYRREADDADIKDFKCLIYVPKNMNDSNIIKGMMIFQTVATYGVKTIAVKKLRAFFAKLGLTLEIRSVSIRSFVEKLVEQGNLYRVTLVKDQISPDPSDNMLISTGREERSYIKPQFQPAWFQKLLLFFDRANESTVYEIEGQSFDDIRVEFKLGTRCRTVGLRYIDRLSVVEDIPDSIYRNGHYSEEDLTNYMIETANAYKEKMIFISA